MRDIDPGAFIVLRILGYESHRRSKLGNEEEWDGHIAHESLCML